jgi:hypothetical protein
MRKEEVIKNFEIPLPDRTITRDVVFRRTPEGFIQPVTVVKKRIVTRFETNVRVLRSR